MSLSERLVAQKATRRAFSSNTEIFHFENESFEEKFSVVKVLTKYRLKLPGNLSLAFQKTFVQW